MGPKITRRKALTGVVATAATLVSPLASAANAKTHEIRIQSFKFVPNHIVVKVGDTIRWINDDIAAHTATAVEFEWDSGNIEHAEFYEIKVTKNMQTEYFCAYHPHMMAKIEIS